MTEEQFLESLKLRGGFIDYTDALNLFLHSGVTPLDANALIHSMIDTGLLSGSPKVGERLRLTDAGRLRLLTAQQEADRANREKAERESRQRAEHRQERRFQIKLTLFSSFLSFVVGIAVGITVEHFAEIMTLILSFLG